MRAFLVRVGVDQAFGGWNAPVDPANNDFVYVPIPEARAMRAALATPYSLVQPALARFAETHPGAPLRSVELPSDLIPANMHLDPDFGHLTYGDNGVRRGKQLAQLGQGDIVVFHGGLSTRGALRAPPRLCARRPLPGKRSRAPRVGRRAPVGRECPHPVRGT